MITLSNLYMPANGNKYYIEMTSYAARRLKVNGRVIGIVENRDWKVFIIGRNERGFSIFEVSCDIVFIGIFRVLIV